MFTVLLILPTEIPILLFEIQNPAVFVYSTIKKTTRQSVLVHI